MRESDTCSSSWTRSPSTRSRPWSRCSPRSTDDLIASVSETFEDLGFSPQRHLTPTNQRRLRHVRSTTSAPNRPALSVARHANDCRDCTGDAPSRSWLVSGKRIGDGRASPVRAGTTPATYQSAAAKSGPSHPFGAKSTRAERGTTSNEGRDGTGAASADPGWYAAGGRERDRLSPIDLARPRSRSYDRAVRRHGPRSGGGSPATVDDIHEIARSLPGV